MANHKIMRFGTAGQWMVVLDGDRGMPEGGFPKQVLTKASSANFIAQWVDPVGFTFTQGAAPTLGLDGTSALATGATWYDTTTNNGYVRVSNAWRQFSWGDSEARYVNVTGDTLTGQLSGITPTAAPNLTRKDYVDAQVATAVTAANTASSTRVAKAGDTMTGHLWMGPGATVDFADELGKKIDLYGGTYYLSIESGTLRYVASAGGGTHAFSGHISNTGAITAGTNLWATSYVRAEGDYVSADSRVYVRNYGKGGHRVYLGDWSGDGGWTGMIGNAGYILMDHVSTAANMHVRANGALNIGGSANDQMTMYNGYIRSHTDHHFSGGIGVSGGGSVGGGFTAGAEYISNWHRDTGQHVDMGFQHRSYGVVSGHSSWLVQHGIAPVMLVTAGNGEMFLFKNNAGSGFAWVGAADFRYMSSREIKTNVQTAPTEYRDRTYEAFKNTRTVVFDDKVGAQHVRGDERFREVNRRWKARGHEPLKLTAEHAVSVDHDCTENHACVGTAEVPCGPYARHKNRRGFIAEELALTLPQAVSFNDQNEPEGISYAVITTELWDVVAHLAERVEELEAQLAK